MTSVTIPKAVIKIDDYAFLWSDLSSIEIPEGVTDIGDGAFQSSRLTSITIPESVVNIGESAFSSTKWLEERQKENPLVIVNNIVIDGTGCVGDVVIPDVVTSIVEGAFTGCSSLNSVTIPESVTNIGEYVFQSKTILKGREGSYAQQYASEHGYTFEVVLENSSDVDDPSDKPSDNKFLAGDVDLDDAKIVLRLAVGINIKNPITAQGEKNADFDISGKVDLKDAIYTLKVAVGVKVTLS